MEVNCPCCGEVIDLWVDPGGADHQRYVEDCSVCCRPLVVTARRDDEGRDFTVEVEAES